MGVDDTSDAPADIFYIHPTTYYSNEGWNAPVDDPDAVARTEQFALALQASAFNAAGTIYAPKYRQATLFAMLSRNEDSQEAIRSAYRDVSRAYLAFQKRRNRSRPFFIVGYGQGALHGLGLLQNHVLGSADRPQLVAAYLIDYQLPQDMIDLVLRDLSLCEVATDYGCVVAWVQSIYGTGTTDPVNPALVWNLVGGLVSTRDRRLTCVNPLTWTADSLPAPNPLNLGGVTLNRIGELDAPVLEISGAQCRGGILFVDRPSDSRFRRMEWPGNEHRIRGFNLFYMNLRQNSQTRLQEWMEANPEP